jgi:septum site-determining protein MinC
LQSSGSVIIKGVREGLLLILDDDAAFPTILTELTERINANPGFFKGAGITINSGRRIIDRPEFDVLYGMLTRNGMRVLSLVSLSAQSRMVAESYGVTSRPPSFAAGDTGGSLGLKGRGNPQPADASATDSVSEAGAGIFLRCNLRPGQSVRYGGDVCVLGDVEPGAEVVADGDIVVWGSLHGVAHAGASGDDEAVICALDLSPTQLGIAGVISRFPGSAERAGEAVRPPELARIEAGRMVVEAWQQSQTSEVGMSEDPPGGT